MTLPEQDLIPCSHCGKWTFTDTGYCSRCQENVVSGEWLTDEEINQLLEHHRRVDEHPSEFL